MSASGCGKYYFPSRVFADFLNCCSSVELREASGDDEGAQALFTEDKEAAAAEKAAEERERQAAVPGMLKVGCHNVSPNLTDHLELTVRIAWFCSRARCKRTRSYKRRCCDLRGEGETRKGDPYTSTAVVQTSFVVSLSFLSFFSFVFGRFATFARVVFPFLF